MIQFEVAWSANSQIMALGTGRLLVAGEAVWGGDAGVEWYWVDLLEYLCENLSAIVEDQEYPLGLKPSSSLQLRELAIARWENYSEEQIEDEEGRVYDWEDAHYLNAGLKGLYARAVCVTRENQEALVCTLGKVHRCPFTEVLEDLQNIGNAIAARIGPNDDLARHWAAVQGSL